MLTMSHITASESPDSSVGHEQQQAKNYYDPDLAHAVHGVDDLHIECPSNTTERKLIARIDGRVIPWLTLMYLLAFLDRYDRERFGLSKELSKINNRIARTSPMHQSLAFRKT